MIRLRATHPPQLACLACATVIAIGCGDSDDTPPASSAARSPTTHSAPSTDVGRVVKVEGDRGLYVSCAGSGSPTVVMEAGDADTNDYYSLTAASLADTTRTCVYDRANLGRSDPAPGPRGLRHLVGDLERLLEVARIPGPYVLVGSSGGGYISAGYALANPRRTAGLVLIDTFAPDPNPPKEVVEETDPDNPANIEQRDYLQVENDAWKARKPIGDVPVRIVTVDYGNAAQTPAERRNVKDQRGWLVLSPRARQVVVHTSHAVVFDDPELVTEIIRDVVSTSP